MVESFSTVREFLETPFYTRSEMVGRLVRDHQTGEEYEVSRLTLRTATCEEMDGGSRRDFNIKYFENFKVLSPEMYANMQ